MTGGEILRPNKVQRDETGNLNLQTDDETWILDIFSPEVLARLNVYRLGHALAVGNTEQPIHARLVRVTSPNDTVYAAMWDEAGPGELAHHPV